MFKRLSLSIAALATTAMPAFAHLNPEEHGSFMSGLSHPLFGADHILAMVAVGLWAAQIGGKARWLVPLTFVATMCLGFGLSLSGIGLPFVEPAILASVIGLGLLVALAIKIPTIASAVIVAAFALFHCHAHGGELGSATALQFGLGFALSTALLHAAGVAIGLSATRFGGAVTRILGALTVLGGAAIAFG
ncbi:MAG: hypothetical protein RLZZ444_4073 [Pseudomonadota bacterium]